MSEAKSDVRAACEAAANQWLSYDDSLLLNVMSTPPAYYRTGSGGGCASDNSDRSRLARVIEHHLTPVFERLRDAVIEELIGRMTKRSIGSSEICDHDRGWNNAIETHQGMFRALKGVRP